MGKGMRPAILFLHRWFGLVLAIFLALIALTGALLAFEDGLTRQMNRGVMTVQPAGTPLSLAAVDAALRRTDPELHVQRWTLPQQPTEALIAQSEDAILFVDPYSGKVLGTQRDVNTFMRQVHILHTRLLLGPIGREIVGWSAVGFLLLNLSGLVLWWKRKIWRVRSGASGPVFRFELHQATAILGWVFLTALAVTGISLHWEEGTHALFDGVPKRPQGTIPQLPAAGKLDADGLVARARRVAPDAQPTVVDLPDAKGKPARVAMKYPEDHTPAGRTSVFIDPETGIVKRFSDLRQASLGFRMGREWNRELHTGAMFGLAGQIVMCIGALCLLTLAVTGPWIWLLRRRVQARKGSFSAMPAE
ncbi:MAG: PepSY-associated TM helix domain-containing protein [Telluria sp.]